MDYTYSKNSTSSKEYFLNNNLLIGGYIDPNLSRIKLILKENKITLLISMIKKAGLGAVPADPKIKASMRVKDRDFPRTQELLRKVAIDQLIHSLYFVY